jgi:uncharacterized protein (TIGR00730 family)
MKNVLIFCAANMGHNTIYAETAAAMATALVNRGTHIITGAGSVGLMGVVADATLAANGTITGIIPTFLDKLEVGHNGLTEIIVVEDMHERKALMHERCDAIIALPGGYGTLDELFESLTWAQLDQHQKPIGLLNVNGFYTHLLAFLDHIVAEGMLKQENRNLVISSDNIEDLINKMEDFKPMSAPKWM